MEHTFWHDRWTLNQVGFHLNYVHPLLIRNLDLFQFNTGSVAQNRIFLPLCGKTLDIGYLLAENYSVVAVELSDIAVQAVLQALDLQPDNPVTISAWAGGKCYQAKHLQIYVGDFFALTQGDLGDVDVVYDRAALIALPEPLRTDYARHLAHITANAPQLLITLDYDQSVAAGPPFAVSTKTVEGLYGNTFAIQLIEEADIIEQEPRFKAKGITAFYERAYTLK
ncbi:MAG: thiopurine S-methyltransferase [Oleispira sp.]|jgi:thiopurine S-methyltransferase